MKQVLFATVFILLSAHVSAQQTQVMKGLYLKDTVRLTAKQGTVSETDTLLNDVGRYGGRFNIYFEGPQRKFFMVDPSLGHNWVGHKIKPNKTMHIPVVFAPPAGFTGEAHAVLIVQGLSLNNWLEVVLIGVSTP